MTIHSSILLVLAFACAASVVVGTSLEIALARTVALRRGPVPAGGGRRGVPA